MSISIETALSGLKVAQQALDITSRNISNASTVGYTRKTLPQENFIIAGQGVGARGLPATRYVNTALIADLNKQAGVTEAYSVRLDYLTRIQDFHGASEAKQSISSKLSSLANAFTALSASPDDLNLLTTTLAAAQSTATTINSFAQLINEMRSNAEQDINAFVNEVNNALEKIAELNVTIARTASIGESTADLEDKRDMAIAMVAKHMDIVAYSDGTHINIMTRQGHSLADSRAYKLYFAQSAMLPDSYYDPGNPLGLSGLRIGGPTGVDITASVGGKLGGLFQLRDVTLPQYQVQLDEFAYQLAARFESQGLMLFTSTAGTVPVGNPALAVPLGSIGFSNQIQVNTAVLANPALLRDGTTGSTELPGSNEVIRRIAQFAFGATAYQQATGTQNIGSGGDLTAGAVSTLNMSGYVGAVTFGSAPPLDTVVPGNFTITMGSATHTINVLPSDNAHTLTNKINAAFGSAVAHFDGTNMSLNYAGPITLADGTLAVSDLGFTAGTTSAIVPVTTNNAVIGNVDISAYTALAGVPTVGAQLPGTFTLTIGGVPQTISIAATDMASDVVNTINSAFGYTVASIGSGGGINLMATADITIGTGTINAAGLTALGLSAGTRTQPSASFQVQVGTRAPVTITIDPGDTGLALLNKLNSTVPGLTATLDGSGYLVMRPTDGGDLTLVDGAGMPLAALGMVVANVGHPPFSQNGMGGGANLSTGLMANSTLQNYISSIISAQSADYNIAKTSYEQEDSFLQTLQSRNDNLTGVNIDEEMAELIRIQSAYSAAAQMITVTREIFQELLNAIR